MHVHQTGEGRFVHKQRGPRERIRSDFWSGNRRKYAGLTLLSILLLGLAFLANLSYLYGSAFHTAVNVHHFRVIYVDYDNDVLGRSLSIAYDSLKGNGFPTLEVVSAARFPTAQTLRNEVCRNKDIWAAVYAHPDASNRLSAAIQGGAAARDYNASNTLSFVWNGARYSTFAQADVYANLQTLIAAAGTVYRNVNASYIHENLDLASSGAIAAAAQPVVASSVDIKPTNQGAKAFYNTVTFVFAIISQFFYVMALNGITMSFGMFTRLSVSANIRIRWGSSLIWSTVIAAVITGVLWGYRQGWPVPASAGVETWLLLTMVCLIHFLVFDTATGFIPAQFMAYFALTWIIFNVTSSIMPLELAPGFYKWHYALPTYELYQLLVTIWTGGCLNTTAIALPVLFAWLILGLIGSWASMIQKCNAATKREDEEEQLIEDIEEAGESSDSGNLEKVMTAADTESIDIKNVMTNTTRASRPDYSRTVSAARSELRTFEDLPTPLWYSVKTPFQDSLGLTPSKTAPARAGARRTISSTAV